MTKSKHITSLGIIVLVFTSFLIDCTKETVTDTDGNVYETVKIGDQVWMAENLKVTHYRDGSAITQVTDNTAWSNLSTEAYCIYDSNASNEVDTYGALYNWYAVSDSRNIAPEGWHVPTDAEWKELEMYLGMSQSDVDGVVWRGTNQGSKLAGNARLWHDGDLDNNSEFGSSDFTALPGGCRNYDGYYGHNDSYKVDNPTGFTSLFWTATEFHEHSSWHRKLFSVASYTCRDIIAKRSGLSVRLLRDREALVERNGLMYGVNSNELFSGKAISDTSETSYKDGMLHGLVKYWYRNQQVEHEANFKNGKLHGPYKKWYDNGQQSFVVFCEDGEFQGPSKSWYENGQQSTEVIYKDSEFHGLKRVWYEDGQLEAELTFSYGKMNGLVKRWNQNGQLEEEALFKDGEWVSSTFIELPEGTIEDMDGNVYNTITIGTQTWMAENLKVTHYRDGTAIPNLTLKSDWIGTSSGAYCYYDNDSSSADTFGVLYNWYAVDDSRNIAPDGWHVPSDEEWSQLEAYLGNNGHNGTEGMVLRSSSGWYDGISGSDDFGFNALPAGLRFYGNNDTDISLVQYKLKGFVTYFWSATEATSSLAYFRMFGLEKSTIDRYPASKRGDGFSVRLLRD